MYGPGTSTFKMSRAGLTYGSTYGSASGPAPQQQKPKFRGYSDEELEEKYASGEISLEQMEEFQKRRAALKQMEQRRLAENQSSLSTAMRSV